MMEGEGPMQTEGLSTAPKREPDWGQLLGRGLPWGDQVAQWTSGSEWGWARTLQTRRKRLRVPYKIQVKCCAAERPVCAVWGGVGASGCSFLSSVS